MQRKYYEAFAGVNAGFEQVRCSLKELSAHPALHRRELRRFEAWAAEACASTNSYLLHALAAHEATKAGRRFARRRAIENKEE